QLNQPFIEQSICLSPLREPKLFEHVVRFEVQALVETFKKGQILCREFATPKSLHYRRNRRVILAHCPTLEAECQIPKFIVSDQEWPFALTPRASITKHMECGGKRSAMPLWSQQAGLNQQKRSLRFAWPPRSIGWYCQDASCTNLTVRLTPKGARY